MNEPPAENKNLRVTMVRCCTVLLEWGGISILTDPWFSMRLWLIPCLRRPGLRLQDLPPLDLVLVSHLHPDHFDLRALLSLKQPPKNVLFPQGAFEKLGKKEEGWEEMFPWSEKTYDQLTIAAVPGPHTGPGPSEINFVLDLPGFGRVFFGGDARLDESVLLRVAKKYSPIRFSMLPVGGTRILGRKTVMSPEDAARAADILQSDLVLPIHEGGVWLSLPPLSLHPGRAVQLKQIMEKRGQGQRILLLKEGESATIG